MTEPINLAQLRERAEAIDRAQTGDEAYALGSIQADDVLVLIDIAEAANEVQTTRDAYWRQTGNHPDLATNAKAHVTAFQRLRDALAQINFDNT
jgi:hypothetical protein